ncbi:hypothetical protein [Niveispirillum sp. BGYR6]|uniref:hypothetical protein n=1 Tax=Niveispirillum sp. BGYR6 TaxID=2971249 RepID=UPI0022B9AA9B|nr:hypothetical protein [Niveispirillum sp. BGYR6]MDG5493668.1 hypothetical protein [Niveispirillum sp. BGYR6]
MRRILLSALFWGMVGGVAPAAVPFPQVPPGPIPAFPGAEGAGAYAVGGRAGAVHIVSNLEDAGPGSLRAAVEATGARMVVFAISGTIHLKKPLKIHNDFITIAGQSAPGDGITLADQPLIIAANHVAMRYLRVRLGDLSRTEDDAVSVTDGQYIILDHISASWSVDETLSVSQKWKPDMKGLDHVTVQWCLISESLNKSVHSKGEHGYGSLVRGSYGARYSFHHNLWAHHKSRMPRPGNFIEADADPDGAIMDFRNNVFYDWHGEAGGYNVDKNAITTYNFINNAYLPGPGSQGQMAFRESAPLARAFFQGNAMAGAVPADPWSLVMGSERDGYRLSQPAEVSPVTTQDALTAQGKVLAYAGASLRRDPVDQRVLAQVRDGKGEVINSQQDVGGWPSLPEIRGPLDSDGDGIPDAVEQERGLDPHDAADSRRPGPDGYTALETYLADIVR